VAPRPQLITYPDSLGGDLPALAQLLDGELAGLFRGVHVLPPYPSSADRGFAPVTYERIDPAFGTWEDIERIARSHDVVVDVMINHISRRSAEFQDFARRGRRSPHADLFVTVDKVWPDGEPPPADIERIVLRRPGSPFTDIIVGDTGETERVWTTFGTAEWSEQIDLDVGAAATREIIARWLRSLASHSVSVVRLDAVGYVTKRAGSSCFMVEPDIYRFLDWLDTVAEQLDLVLLPEVHDRYETHLRLAAHGHWTYDFVLPGLVLDALEGGRAGTLASHLAASPARQFTTLDCHDGIPVRPDLDGILAAADLRRLADRVVDRGGNVSPTLSPGRPGGLDVHQLNCTYHSALGGDDDRYLAARAIQLFARGVPQVYYVGLLAGSNDQAAVDRVGDGRAVNRHDYTAQEITAALARPVVGRVMDLIRLRNEHPAFDGMLRVEHRGGGVLDMRWTNGDAKCALHVDVESGRLDVDATR
jgi:sucrose 6(F)-phosphate phosphorylase